jgi:hypothetical protein
MTDLPSSHFSLGSSLGSDLKLERPSSDGIVVTAFKEVISEMQSQYLGHTRSATSYRIADVRVQENQEFSGASDQESLDLKRIRITPTKIPVPPG